MSKKDAELASLSRDLTDEEIESVSREKSDKTKRNVGIWLYAIMEVAFVVLLVIGIVFLVRYGDEEGPGLGLTIAGGLLIFFSLPFYAFFFKIQNSGEKKLTDKIFSQVIRKNFGNDAMYSSFDKFGQDLLKLCGLSNLEIQKGGEKIAFVENGKKCMLAQVETINPAGNGLAGVIGGAVSMGPLGIALGAFSALDDVAKGKNITQIFKGTILIDTGLGKDVPQKIVVRTHDGGTQLSSSGLGGSDRIVVDSADFEKRFDVFCKDRQLAFYILTPHLMEALVEIEKRFPGGMTVVFDKGVIIFAFRNASLNLASMKKDCNGFYSDMVRKMNAVLSDYSDINEKINLEYLSKNVFKVKNDSLYK